MGVSDQTLQRHTAPFNDPILWTASRQSLVQSMVLKLQP